MPQRRNMLVLSVVSAVSLAGQSLTPAERSANLQSFEQVWTTVRDKHWDPKLNGLDWQAIHDELRPKVEAAKNMDTGREALNDMGRGHKQTHFGIFPGDVYHDLEACEEDGEVTGEAHPGIDLRVPDGRAIGTGV